MVPTLHDGDVILVRLGSRVRPGEVVVGRYRSLPDLAVVKRAVRPVDGGWWLGSDNGAAGGDSAVHGVADVNGRVLLRGRRPLRVSRVMPIGRPGPEMPQ